MFNDPSGADPPCTGCPDNGSAPSGPSGGPLPLYMYGPPPFMQDMSNEEWFAYTRPGGMPSIAYETQAWDAENQAIMADVRAQLLSLIHI